MGLEKVADPGHPLLSPADTRLPDTAYATAVKVFDLPGEGFAPVPTPVIHTRYRVENTLSQAA